MATKPPPLVWANGQPMRRDTLGREIAAPAIGTVRSIQSGHPAQGLTPQRLAALLRSAEQGDAIAYYELAEEMEEKDLHYLSVISTRKRAVAQMPITVEPADQSEQAKADAALVEKWLDRDMLESELFDILDAIGKGVSSTEIIWDMKPKSWLPRALKWRDPRFFEFDRVDGETLRLRGNDGPEDLPAAKFITHFHPAKSGLPIRSGLARIAAWGYMFKNFAIKDWVTFLEAFGQPIRLGKYGPNESEVNKNILWQALMDLGTDAAAAFPETMSVEFIDRKAGTAPNDLWRSHAEYFDLQISKAVLGQTNTTDAQAGGLGSGQAEVHDRVRGDIKRSDGKITAASLNRDLVPALVIFNHGPRDAYPRVKIEEPDPFDAGQEIENAGKLVAMGVQIDGEELRDKSGLPAAKSEATALKPPGNGTPPQEPGEGAGEPSRPDAAKKSAQRLLTPLKSKIAVGADEVPAVNSTAQEREPDFIELTTEEALSDWEAVAAPLLDPVDRLMSECADLRELQQRLPEIIGAMDESAFQQLLARAGFAARVQALAAPASEG